MDIVLVTLVLECFLLVWLFNCLCCTVHQFSHITLYETQISQIISLNLIISANVSALRSQTTIKAHFYLYVCLYGLLFVSNSIIAEATLKIYTYM